MGQPIPRVDIPAKLPAGPLRRHGACPAWGGGSGRQAARTMRLLRRRRREMWAFVTARRQLPRRLSLRASAASQARTSWCVHGDETIQQAAVATARGRSRQRIRGPIRRTARSAPLGAVAQSVNDTMTVWDPYPGRLSGSAGHRGDVARTACSVRLIHVEGSRDVTAITAPTMPRRRRLDRPRVARSRSRAVDARAELRGTVWPAMGDERQGLARRQPRHRRLGSFDVWSNTHSMRPGGAGSSAGGPADGATVPLPAPRPLPLPLPGRRR